MDGELSFGRDVYVWLAAHGVVPPPPPAPAPAATGARGGAAAAAAAAAQQQVALDSGTAALFLNGLAVGSLVQEIASKKNIGTLVNEPLKTLFTPVAKLHNWNALTPALERLGAPIDADSKALIVAGDCGLLARVIRQLYVASGAGASAAQGATSGKTRGRAGAAQAHAAAAHNAAPAQAQPQPQVQAQVGGAGAGGSYARQAGRGASEPAAKGARGNVARPGAQVVAASVDDSALLNAGAAGMPSPQPPAERRSVQPAPRGSRGTVQRERSIGAPASVPADVSPAYGVPSYGGAAGERGRAPVGAGDNGKTMLQRLPAVELLAQSLGRAFHVKPAQAHAMLADGARELLVLASASAARRGGAGAASHLADWLELVGGDTHRVCVALTADARALPTALAALRAGMFSYDSREVLLAVRALTAVGAELGATSLAPQAFQWFVSHGGGGLEAVVVAMQRHASLDDHVLMVLVAFAGGALRDVLAGPLVALLVDPAQYLNELGRLLAAMARNESVRAASLQSGVPMLALDVALQHCDGADAQHSAAASLLADVWELYPDAVASRPDGERLLVATLKKGLRVASTDVQLTTAAVLFRVLHMLIARQHPETQTVFKSLVFSLVEHGGHALLRDYLLAAMTSLLEEDPSVPVNVLVEPVLKQLLLRGYHNLHIDFLIAVARHPRLAVRQALLVLDALGRMCVSDALHARAASVPLVLLLKQFAHEKRKMTATKAFSNEEQSAMRVRSQLVLEVLAKVFSIDEFRASQALRGQVMDAVLAHKTAYSADDPALRSLLRFFGGAHEESQASIVEREQIAGADSGGPARAADEWEDGNDDDEFPRGSSSRADVVDDALGPPAGSSGSGLGAARRGGAPQRSTPSQASAGALESADAVADIEPPPLALLAGQGGGARASLSEDADFTFEQRLRKQQAAQRHASSDANASRDEHPKKRADDAMDRIRQRREQEIKLAREKAEKKRLEEEERRRQEAEELQRMKDKMRGYFKHKKAELQSEYGIAPELNVPQSVADMLSLVDDIIANAVGVRIIQQNPQMRKLTERQFFSAFVTGPVNKGEFLNLRARREQERQRQAEAEAEARRKETIEAARRLREREKARAERGLLAPASAAEAERGGAGLGVLPSPGSNSHLSLPPQRPGKSLSPLKVTRAAQAAHQQQASAGGGGGGARGRSRSESSSGAPGQRPPISNAVVRLAERLYGSEGAASSSGAGDGGAAVASSLPPEKVIAVNAAYGAIQHVLSRVWLKLPLQAVSPTKPSAAAQSYYRKKMEQQRSEQLQRELEEKKRHEDEVRRMQQRAKALREQMSKQMEEKQKVQENEKAEEQKRRELEEQRRRERLAEQQKQRELDKKAVEEYRKKRQEAEAQALSEQRAREEKLREEKRLQLEEYAKRKKQEEDERRAAIEEMKRKQAEEAERVRRAEEEREAARKQQRDKLTQRHQQREAARSGGMNDSLLTLGSAATSGAHTQRAEGASGGAAPVRAPRDASRERRAAAASGGRTAEQQRGAAQSGGAVGDEAVASAASSSAVASPTQPAKHSVASELSVGDEQDLQRQESQPEPASPMTSGDGAVGDGDRPDEQAGGAPDQEPAAEPAAPGDDGGNGAAEASGDEPGDPAAGGVPSRHASRHSAVEGVPADDGAHDGEVAPEPAAGGDAEASVGVE